MPFILDSKILGPGLTENSGEKGMPLHVNKLGIFAGADLSTAMLLKIVSENVFKCGWSITVFYTPNLQSIKKAHSKLGKFYLYERMALPDLHEILDQYPIVGDAACFSPKGLSRKYGLNVEEVSNVNSPEFLTRLKTENFNGALSVRCLQKFSPSFIQMFSKQEGKFLWNLHSGALPEYRGFMPLFRTMLNNQRQATLTLHEIDEGIDTGAIIDSTTLDIKRSLLEVSCASVSDGSCLIINALENQARGLIRPIQQKSGPVNRYFAPLPEEVDQFEALGFKLFPSNAIEMIARAYANEQKALFEALQHQLKTRVSAFDQNALFLKQSSTSNSFFSQKGREALSENLSVSPFH